MYYICTFLFAGEPTFVLVSSCCPDLAVSIQHSFSQELTNIFLMGFLNYDEVLTG